VTKERFQANLQREGVALEEMTRMLEAFAKHGDIERLAYQVLEENLLGKTSGHTVKGLLAAFKQRFLQPHDLPSALLVAQAVQSEIPETAKQHILFPYYLSGDPLIEQCYKDLVLPRLEGNGYLSRDEVIQYLAALGGDHPELNKWSDYLRLRWSRGFLSFLRHFGLMERTPSTRLRPLWLTPEAFAFFWLWMWRKENSFWEVAKQPFWKLLQVNERYQNKLLVEGQVRGWWTYQRSGSIASFNPHSNTLEEWLQYGLD